MWAIWDVTSFPELSLHDCGVAPARRSRPKDVNNIIRVAWKLSLMRSVFF